MIVNLEKDINLLEEKISNTMIDLDNTPTVMSRVDKMIQDEKRNYKKCQMELDDKNDEVIEFKKQVKLLEEKERLMLNTLIKVSDELQLTLDYYQKVKKMDVYENLLVNKKYIDKYIMDLGVIEIQADEGCVMSDIYHNPIAVEEKEGYEKYQIIRTVRSGYIYKNKIIREADIIVAK